MRKRESWKKVETEIIDCHLPFTVSSRKVQVEIEKRKARLLKVSQSSVFEFELQQCSRLVMLLRRGVNEGQLCRFPRYVYASFMYTRGQRISSFLSLIPGISRDELSMKSIFGRLLSILRESSSVKFTNSGESDRSDVRATRNLSNESKPPC